jgi:hypothetical protein
MTDNQPVYESAIDKQIREAMERGEFEDLRGAGKPLTLDDDPYVPADWRLAFKILKDAGVAPEWIEKGKAIRAELEALAALLEREVHHQRARRARLNTLNATQLIAEWENLEHARAETCQVYRERATALNQMIDTYNLQVPDMRLQVPRVQIEEEIHRFEEACTNL